MNYQDGRIISDVIFSLEDIIEHREEPNEDGFYVKNYTLTEKNIERIRRIVEDSISELKDLLNE